jgi:Mlc titration factor MtfA (ptsG expression regulator)
MSILRKHHRKKLLEESFPEHWEEVLRSDVPYLTLLNDDESHQLRDTVQILVEETYWEGCDGLEVDDQMKVVVAAHAAIMLLHLDTTDYLHNVRTFLLYPAAYVQTQERVGSDGLVHSGSANLGEAWYNGPVVLSWRDAIKASHTPGRGLNVVFHELAHAVDMMTGTTNGTPMLRDRSHYADWHRVMSDTFTKLRKTYAAGKQDVIRPYGLTNVAEFFAVTTECFFDAPRPLKTAHPEVYEHFSKFWGQDPAARPWPQRKR